MPRTDSARRLTVRSWPWVNFFDGNGDDWTFGNVYSFERTDSWFAAGFFKAETIRTAEQAVVLSKGVSASGLGHHVFLTTAGLMGVVIANSAVNRINKRMTVAVVPGVWYFWAYRYNGTSLASGLDVILVKVGEPLTAFSTTSTITDALTLSIITAQSLRLGARQSATTEEWHGMLGMTMIGAGNPTLDELQDLYYDGMIPSQAQSLWLGRNTNGSGATLSDEIGAINGTGEGTLANRWSSETPFKMRTQAGARTASAARTPVT